VLNEAVQDELLAHVQVLETFGPQLGRPRVDTLKGSRHSNMKNSALMPRTAFGGLHSPLTQHGRLSSCAAATSQAEVRSASISN
jgi:hypothetical protein